MRALNRVELIGRLGADPEIRYTQSGDAVANVNVATNEQWTDKQTGEKREETEWHRCVLWRRLAEIAGEYLTKGARVYIAGSLKTRKWQDQSGQDRYTTEVQVRDMIMLDSQQTAQTQGQGHQQQGQQQRRPQGGNGQRHPSMQNPQHSASYDAQAPAGGGFDDDIPF